MKTFEKLLMFKMSHGNSVKIENYKSLLRVCEFGMFFFPHSAECYAIQIKIK